MGLVASVFIAAIATLMIWIFNVVLKIIGVLSSDLLLKDCSPYPIMLHLKINLIRHKAGRQ